jgi:hypothetical protein
MLTNTAATALMDARVYLNDIEVATYSDARLMPALQVAFKEMSSKLIANGISNIREQSAIISVAALTDSNTGPITLTTPTDMITPIQLLERFAGGMTSDFILMQQRDFVPDVDPASELIYWAWIGQKIQLVGATSDNEVQVRYNGYLPIPQTVNDSLGFAIAETFLGPKIASIMMPSRKDLETTAERNLHTIIAYNVNAEQANGKMRVGYRRQGRLRIW